MVKHVIKHTEADSAQSQVALAKNEGSEFSHPEAIPLKVGVRSTGWMCRKVVVQTIEPVWYHDAVTHIEIPPNFVCDLASVPRAFWFFASPYDLAYEGLIHDELYRSQKTTRRYADFMFFQLMEKRNVPCYVRYPAWAAVRLFGGKAWEANKRRLKNA